MSLFKTIFLVMVCVFVSSGISAQESTAQDVINNYIDAIGGRQALDDINTMRYERHLIHLEEDTTYKQMCYQKRENTFRYDTPERGTSYIVEHGKRYFGRYDAESSQWNWDTGDYTSKEGYILNRLGTFLDYEKREISLKYVAVDTIGGRPAHHLEMYLSEEVKWDLYFDVETRLWVMMKPSPTTAFAISDYRKVGNVLFPFISEGQGKRPDGRDFHHINKMICVEINVEFPDNLFDPESVNAK